MPPIPPRCKSAEYWNLKHVRPCEEKSSPISNDAKAQLHCRKQQNFKLTCKFVKSYEFPES